MPWVREQLGGLAWATGLKSGYPGRVGGHCALDDLQKEILVSEVTVSLPLSLSFSLIWQVRSSGCQLHCSENIITIFSSSGRGGGKNEYGMTVLDGFQVGGGDRRLSGKMARWIPPGRQIRNVRAPQTANRHQGLNILDCQLKITITTTMTMISMHLNASIIPLWLISFIYIYILLLLFFFSTIMKGPNPDNSRLPMNTEVSKS